MLKVNLAWNPYLFGSLVLMLFWAIGLVIVRRRDITNLREFWWSSLACSLLGVTEPLFVPEYWFPPSILQLWRWDLESFVFCFAVGGIIAAFPEVPPARRLFDDLSTRLGAWLQSIRRSVMAWLTRGGTASGAALAAERARAPEMTRTEVVQDNMILAAAFLGAFGTTAHFGLNIIYDSSIVCVAMALFIGWRRPRLRWQILSGAFSFTLIYAITLGVVGAVYPEFYKDHWNLAQLSNCWIINAPAEEYLFAATLGLFWAPLYEAWKHVDTAPAPG